jgi:hypothetical protein
MKVEKLFSAHSRQRPKDFVDVFKGQPKKTGRSVIFEKR